MPTTKEELLRDWFRRLRESQFSHYESGKAYEHFNYRLGIPVVVLSTIVGTSVFASVGKSVNPWLQIVVGLISVTAAVLASLQTFLRFSERAEKHRAVGARYGSLRREIEETLAVDGEIDSEKIAALRQRIDKLAEEAPNVPSRTWTRTQKELAKELGDNRVST